VFLVEFYELSDFDSVVLQRDDTAGTSLEPA